MRQILVCTPGNRLVTLEVAQGSSLTAADLRQLITAKTGIPGDLLRLYQEGRPVAGVLEDNNDNDGSEKKKEENATAMVRVLLSLPGGVPAEKTINVFVKILGGRHTTFSVSSEATVAQLQAKVQTAEGLEADRYELMFRGERLAAERTLSSYLIADESSIEAVIPTSPVRIPKGRCALPDCTDRVAKIVGDCRYCGQGYCSRHRLPESHDCENIQGCKQQSYEKNSSKLMGEKCVADKV